MCLFKQVPVDLPMHLALLTLPAIHTWAWDCECFKPDPFEDHPAPKEGDSDRDVSTLRWHR